MVTRFVSARSVRRTGLAGLVMFCAACHGSEPTAAAPSAVPVAAAAAAPQTTPLHEPLPRIAASVALGMRAAEAEAALGPLTCHDSTAGLKVCRGALDRLNDISKLELYFHRERVISLAYEVDVPPNAWDFLDRNIARYGHPSLSGKREQDQTGRTHEVFGWKDADSLYSIRLIWADTEKGSRDLMGTAITLWDRRAYQEWEAEALHRDAAPRVSDRTGAAS